MILCICGMLFSLSLLLLVGLAQLAEREVSGSIPGAGPILRVLK